MNNQGKKLQSSIRFINNLSRKKYLAKMVKKGVLGEPWIIQEHRDSFRLIIFIASTFLKTVLQLMVKHLDKLQRVFLHSITWMIHGSNSKKESEGTSEQDSIFIIIMWFINKTETAQLMKIQHGMRKHITLDKRLNYIILHCVLEGFFFTFYTVLFLFFTDTTKVSFF